MSFCEMKIILERNGMLQDISVEEDLNDQDEVSVIEAASVPAPALELETDEEPSSNDDQQAIQEEEELDNTIAAQ